MQLDTEIEDFHCKLDKEITDIRLLLEDKLLTVKPQYNIHYNLKTWADADASSKNLNSSLAKLETIKKWKFVAELIESPCSAWNSFWTSGINQGQDSWVWRGTEEEIGAELWASNEPSGMVTVHFCMLHM